MASNKQEVALALAEGTEITSKMLEEIRITEFISGFHFAQDMVKALGPKVLECDLNPYLEEKIRQIRNQNE